MMISYQELVRTFLSKDDDYEKYGVGPQYVFRCAVNK